jgi:osmoprotectant transport system ATP-binding protein
VSFQHQSASLPRVSDISFSCSRGETSRFVGTSGRGQDDAGEAARSAVSPLSGRILYNASPATKSISMALRAQIGFVTQDYAAVLGTIRETSCL